MRPRMSVFLELKLLIREDAGVPQPTELFERAM